MNTINQKLRSVELCLSAHPHNEPDSEFADRISDLQEIQPQISEFLKQRNDMREKLQFFLDSKDEILRALDFANEMADDYRFLFEGLEDLIESTEVNP